MIGQVPTSRSHFIFLRFKTRPPQIPSPRPTLTSVTCSKRCSSSLAVSLGQQQEMQQLVHNGGGVYSEAVKVAEG